MDGFSIGKIILGLRNPELFLKKLKGEKINNVGGFAPELNSSTSNSKPQQGQLLQNLQNLANITRLLYQLSLYYYLRGRVI